MKRTKGFSWQAQHWGLPTRIHTSSWVADNVPDIAQVLEHAGRRVVRGIGAAGSPGATEAGNICGSALWLRLRAYRQSEGNDEIPWDDVGKRVDCDRAHRVSTASSVVLGAIGGAIAYSQNCLATERKFRTQDPSQSRLFAESPVRTWWGRERKGKNVPPLRPPRFAAGEGATARQLKHPCRSRTCWGSFAQWMPRAQPQWNCAGSDPMQTDASRGKKSRDGLGSWHRRNARESDLFPCS